VVLFTDATILTETPPLRACWSPVGEQAAVPVTGNRAKRVLYGTVNIRTGAALLSRARRWNGEEFRRHLAGVRSRWRGWRIVLFLDRGGPHTARLTRQLAGALGVELRFLPTACPELNPVEGLWRYAKGWVLANEPTPDIDAALERVCDALMNMTGIQRLQLAGVLSENFWLPT
jgi:DDE superfamily endonuclease